MMKRRSESGNIFFMLFGAVALVGVVAAATSTLMRGPLSTVVNVNARAKADTQMQIAAKLAMVRASQQNGPGAPPAWTSGDCDSDGNVEPIPAKDAGPKPQGGGQLPESIGASQQDPWGNAYGYCVWDIGTKNADGACNVGAGEVARLKGDYNNDYPVMLIVSSGPDRTFQTQCNDWVVTHSGPLVTDNWPNNFVGTNADQHTTATAGDVIYKPTGSDDIVISYSYDQASQVAGGLWSLMKSDPNKITTNKDIDVQTKANFASTATFQGAANFDPGSRIDLGFDRVGADTAGLFKLPNQTSLSTCNAANDGALRLNIVGTHNALQICDGKAGPAAWVDPSASGMTVTKIDDLTDAIASFSSQSKNIMLGDGTGINFTSASAGGNNVMLGIGSAANLASGGANSDNVILGSNTATSLTGGAHNIIIGSNINVPNAATSDFLTIGNLIYGTGMNATGSTASTGNVGIGVAAPAVKLQVAGTVQGTQFQFNSSNALSFASSDITLSYGGVSQLFINGSGLGVGISPTHKLDVDGDAYAQRFVSTFSSASTLPGFAFGGDLNTGISHPGASIIGLTVGGAEKARLNSTGLGIGTNAPTVALDVVGAGAFTTTVNAGTAFQFGSSNGMYNQGGGLSFNTGGAPRVYVTGTGLGVGLATPMVSIDAAGAIRAGMTTTCDSTVTGAIRFTSDTLEYCSIDGNWYSLFTAGGGGGGSNLWTNNTTYISRANAHFINASQSLPPALASAGTRFFWYPNKASFRAGGDGGSAWDDLNIGNYSTGLGYDTRASGDYSFSAGRTTDATGNYSFALGQGAVASGAHSFAFGLGSPSGTRPIVSGTNSFGIFMGDQNGRNITSSNTMELLGGKFLIDANPMFASSSTIGGLLTMDVNGDVGAEQYCDSDGAYCFTAESISTGAVGVFELSSNVIRMTSGPGNYATSSYVFGSPTLADDGDASHRKRLFFDKGSGSFRTGGTSGTQWDSVGAYSNGMGYDTVATGNYSVAIGQKVSATNTNSVAFGLGAAAGAAPTVSGAGSYGIFMGDQSAVNLSFSSTLGLFGGRMVIDPKNPATQLYARSVLDLGAATDAIVLPAGITAERPATAVNGMLRYNSANGKFEGYQGGAWQDILTSAVSGGAAAPDRGVQFNSGNNFAAVSTFIFTSAGRLGVGTATPTETLDIGTGRLTGGTYSALYRNTLELSGDSGQPAMDFALAGNGHFHVAMTSMVGTNDIFYQAIPPSTAGYGIFETWAGSGTIIGTGNATPIIFRPNRTEKMRLTSAGNLGIGTVAPLASLEVAGTDAILFPRGTSSDRPSAPVNGMIRYNSGSGKFEGYQGGAWQDILTSAVSGGAAAPDRGIQFNSGNNFAASSNLVYSSSGAFMVSGTYTGGSALPASGAGTRMFFVPGIAAFRAGTVAGTEWDTSNLGTYSVAMGYGNLATSAYTVALGVGSRATSGYAVAIGQGVNASGNNGFGTGHNTVASGAVSTAMGEGSTASGAYAVAIGYANISKGSRSVTLGNVLFASGTASSAFGYGATTTGDYAMALGFGSASGANPIVSGTSSYGLFMGNQGGVTLAASNTMGLFGGKFVIDPSTPATYLAAQTALDVNGSIKISDGGETCATLIKGAIRFTSLNTLQYCNGTAWTSTASSGSNVIAIDDLSDAVTQYTSGGSMYLGSGVGGSANGGGNTVLGYNAFSTSVGAQSNTAIGFEAMRYANNTGSGTATGNTAVGYQALTGAAGTGAGNTGIDNTAIGAGALASVTTATSNAAIGFHTLASTTTGNYNMGMGTFAGAYNTTGSRNTAVGVDSLTENRANSDIVAIGYKALEKANDTTSGTSVYNVAIGNYALQGSATAANNTGTYNTAIGHSALNGNTSGSNNVAVGPSSLGANTVGASNVAIGYQALNTNVGAQQSTAVGYEAMRYANSTTGATLTLNTALGYQALRGSTTAASNTGTWNTAVGSSALSANTSGLENTAIGAAALTANTTGGDNAAFGAGSLRYNMTGAANMGFGSWALYTNVSGSDNVGIGMQALYSNTAGSQNVAVGRNSLYYSSGSYNTAIGYNAGFASTTGSFNILIGPNTQTPTVTTSNWLNIGNLLTGDMSAGLAYVSSNGALMLPVGTTAQRPLAGATVNGMIRYNSGSGKFEGYQGGSWQDILTSGGGSTTAAGANTQVQFNSGGILGAASTFTFDIGTGILGTSGGYRYGGVNALRLTTQGNPVVGETPMSLTLSPFSVAVGKNALASVTTEVSGVAVGNMALVSNTVGTGVTAVGANALLSNAGAADNTAIGYNAMVYTNSVAAATYAGNTAVGSNALKGPNSAGTNTGLKNTAIGAYALSSNTTGSNNVALGETSLLANTTGSNNIAIGNSTGAALTTGSNNILFGSAVNVPASGTSNYMSIGNLIFASGGFGTGIAVGTGLVGIRTATPRVAFDINGTDAVMIAAGTTAQRPAASAVANGMIRYNSDLTRFEGYQSGIWLPFSSGGGSGVVTVIDDLTDAITNYTGSVSASSNSTYSLFLGAGVGATAAAGAMYNTGLGYNSLMALNTGTYNTAYGALSLSAITSGIQNTAIGSGALSASTTGSYNIAVGSQALYLASASNNVAIGYQSLLASTGGSNTAVGNNALTSNGGRVESTAVGLAAMAYAYSGAANVPSYNTAVGAYALRGSTTAANNTGTANTAVGHSALMSITSGIYNNALGTSALLSNTSGSHNTAMGASALSDNVTGSGNAAFGAWALGSSTGNSNTAIGMSALTSNLDGSNNVALGTSALSANVSKGESTAIGYNAMSNANSLAVTGITYNTAVGAYALRGGATAASNTGIANTALGHRALMLNTSGSFNTALGSGVLQSGTTGLYNTGVGTNALVNMTSANDNIGIGVNALNDTTIGGGNIAIGNNALYTNVARGSSVAIGNLAMRYTDSTTSNIAAYNVAVGTSSLSGSTTAAANTGTNNTAIGALSFTSMTSGSNNIALGYNAGSNITSGSSNLMMGYNISGQSATASNQMSIGNLIFASGGFGTGTTVGTGFVGIRTASPRVTFDITGTDAMMIPAGLTANRPGTTVAANGMMRYNTSTANFEGYQNGSWLPFSSASSSATSAAGSTTQVQFNSGGILAASGALTFSSGALMNSGTYSGVNYIPTSGAGSRMFFDPAGGAFRAGRAISTEWDAANVGVSSVAIGIGGTASGYGSLTLGFRPTAGMSYDVGIGYFSYASGGGGYNTAIGPQATATGGSSVALGGNVTASGQNSLAMGRYTTASGTYSTTFGNGTAASGMNSTAMGYMTFASADYSMAMGLGGFVSAPRVTGAGSYGIFMGAQTASVMLAATNTMGLFGGKMVIDPNAPATQLTARGVLDLGAATDAIVLPSGTTAQQPASAVNGMLRYNSTNGKFEGYQAGAWQDILTGAATMGAAAPDRGIQFNSGGVTFANAGLTYNSAGALTVGDTSVGNGMMIKGAASGSNPSIVMTGADANVGLELAVKGSAGFSFTAGTYIPATFYGNGEGWVRSDSNGSGRAGFMMSAAGGNVQWIMTANGSNVFTIQAGNNVNSSPTVFSIDGSGNGQFGGLGALLVNAGSTADRPAAAINGMIRYNSTGKNFEGYQNGSWLPFSSASASPVLAIDDLTDAITVYSSGSMYVGAYSGATASGNNNTSFGYMAFGSAGNTAQNTAIGYEAMRYAESTSVNRNTKNTAVGFRALRGSSTASANTGTFNVAFGTNALQNNTSGDNNAAIGVDALGVNTTGANNSAFGAEALAANTTGSQNTAIGLNALYSNTAGSLNTAIGVAAMEANVARQENTAIGYNAMRYADSTVTTASSYNTAIGNYALQGSTTAANNTGINNTAIGYAALKLVTSGSSNMAIGVNALNTNATGSNNIAIGRSAGSTLTSGSNNLLFGSGVTTPAANTSDFMTIGNLIFASGGFGTVTTPGIGFIGIRTASPRVTMDIAGTDAMMIPSGTVAQRPAASAIANGMIRYNTDNTRFEGYQNGSWLPFSSSTGSAAVTPAGSNTQLQFNSGGTSLGASANLTFSSLTNTLAVTGKVSVTDRISIAGTSGLTTPSGLSLTNLSDVSLGALASGKVLTYNGTNWAAATPSSVVTPAGSTTQIQFNSGGTSLGATPDLTFNSTFSIFAAAGSSFMGAYGSSGQLSSVEHNSGYAGTVNAFHSGGDTFGAFHATLASASSGKNQYALIGINSGAATYNWPTVSAISAGQYLPGIGFAGQSDSSVGPGTVLGASIVGYVDGTVSSGVLPSALVFHTSQTNATGLTERMRIGSNGLITFSSTGAILITSGTTAQRPTSPINGMIRYNSSSDKFEGYQAGSWQDIITAGGTAATPDRGIQFNSGNAFNASANLIYTSSGAFMAAGTFTGTLATPTSGAGSRMFYDPAGAVFRAGYVSGTQWNTANMGTYSAAFGINNTASGQFSFAVGNGTTASGGYSAAMGALTMASGGGSTAMGFSTVAGGFASTAMGSTTVANGMYSTALGYNVSASSDTTVAIGLGAFASRPAVTGIGSLGIFMGAQTSAVQLAATNTMGLFGGKFVIDPNAPATQLIARGVLDLGAANDAMVMPIGTLAQRPGTPVNGMVRYNTSSANFEGYQNGSWLPFSSSTAGAAGALDGLSDAKTDYVIDNNLLIGTPADAYAIAATGTYNLALGQLAGDSITTGDNNIAIGYRALTAVTTAGFNTAIGKDSLMSNTSGVDNTAIGDNASSAATVAYGNVGVGNNTLATNVRKSRNTAVGASAMQYTNSAAVAVDTDNTAIGWSALQGSTTAGNNTGVNNTAVGSAALWLNTSGQDNTAVGLAMRANTTGGSNVAVGNWALGSNTVASGNTAIGWQSMTSNKAGSQSVAIGTNAMQYANDSTTPFTTYNTAVGYQAMRGSGTAGNNTGINNTAVGHNSMLNMTGGYDNTAVGASALLSNTTGFYNTAVGSNALASATGGSFNTAVGYSALSASQYGFNAALGYRALRANTTGSQNNAFGYMALDANTVGTNNSVMGFQAALTNVGGSDIVAIGISAMQNANDAAGAFTPMNTAVGANALQGGATASANTGTNNTAIGFQTMKNTTSGSANATLGDGSLLNNTTGSRNVAIGAGNGSTLSSLYTNITGNDSTAVGYTALALSTGNANTALGSGAGDNITSGASNIIIGVNVDAQVATASNQMSIGNLIFASGGFGTGTTVGTGFIGIKKAAPTVALDVVGDIQYTGVITDVSDRRLKTNIVPLSNRGSMLDRVAKIGTYSFVMKDDPKGNVEFGVMAQEMKDIFPELVKTDFTTPEHYLSVNYMGMIAPIIQSTRELKAENDNLKSRLAELEAEQKETHADIQSLSRDIKGMKAYTGYGIDRAGMDGWMMLMIGMIFGGGTAAFAYRSGSRRRQG